MRNDKKEPTPPTASGCPYEEGIWKKNPSLGKVAVWQSRMTEGVLLKIMHNEQDDGNEKQPLSTPSNKSKNNVISPKAEI
jgi:hypothetical protein